MVTQNTCKCPPHLSEKWTDVSYQAPYPNCGSTTRCKALNGGLFTCRLILHKGHEVLKGGRGWLYGLENFWFLFNVYQEVKNG